MPLRGLSYREVARKLRKAGFKEVGQKGSHVKFAKETEEGEPLLFLSIKKLR